MAANQKVRATNPVLSRTSAVLKFGPGDEFHQELRRRIDQYFTRTGLKRRDCPQMYLKTAVVLGWLAASYALLVFVAGSWWLTDALTARGVDPPADPPVLSFPSHLSPASEARRAA
jgi:hypothetical protein